MADIYAVVECCQHIGLRGGVKLAAIGLVDNRGDIGHGLPRLRRGIADMHGEVSDDAGRAGNEQQLLAGKTDQRATREGRCARAIVAGVVPGTDLAGIFQRTCRQPTGHEGDGQRAAAHAQRTGCRHAAAGQPQAGQEGILTAGIELPVAFQPAIFRRFAVDVGKVVPDTPELWVALGIEQAKNAAVGFLGRTLQWRGCGTGIRAEIGFVDLQHAIEHLRIGAVADALLRTGATFTDAPPEFAKVIFAAAQQRCRDALHRQLIHARCTATRAGFADAGGTERLRVGLSSEQRHRRQQGPRKRGNTAHARAPMPPSTMPL